MNSFSSNEFLHFLTSLLFSNNITFLPRVKQKQTISTENSSAMTYRHVFPQYISASHIKMSPRVVAFCQPVCSALYAVQHCLLICFSHQIPNHRLSSHRIPFNTSIAFIWPQETLH
jgi:hypothetical protein